MVNSFLFNATQKYNDRYAFTFNFYPYFDPNLILDPDTKDQCTQSLSTCRCFNSAQCAVPASTLRARAKMQQLTGRAQSTLWVGETGWSSPQSRSLATRMAQCEAWSDTKTFQSFYEGFLHWDLMSLRGALPDHAFYFTARDSVNFGVGEHFGLIATCSDVRCKLHSKDYGTLALPAAKGMLASSVTSAQSVISTTLLPYDCATSSSDWNFWSPGKKAWCCIHDGLNCPMPTSTTMVLPALEPTSTKFYDCNSISLVDNWNEEQQAWCCKYQGRGCELSATQLPTTSTKTYNCHDVLTLPLWGTKQKNWCCNNKGIGCSVMTTSFPYDCTFGYSNWRTAWSVMKKAWCCPHDGHGCKTTSLPLSRTSSIRDCTAHGCELTATTTMAMSSRPFDCRKGYSTWEKGWSDRKKAWCCRHRRLGCSREITVVGAKFDQASHARPAAASTSPQVLPRTSQPTTSSQPLPTSALHIFLVSLVSGCLCVAFVLRCSWTAASACRTNQPYAHLHSEDLPLTAVE